MAKIAVNLDASELSQLPAFLRNMYAGDSSLPAINDDDMGNPPPIDSSIGGADNPTGQPASGGDSKLTNLRKVLAGQSEPDVPAPPITLPGQGNQMPPADLSQSLADNQADINPTFREAHPTLAKILGLTAQFAQDAGPGVGSRTFGEGFQTATAQPFVRQQRNIEIQKGQADVAHTNAATQQMQSQVTLPNGLTVPFALAQRLYPTVLTEQGKNTRNTDNINSRESIADSKNTLALRSKGLKPNPDDPDGPPVPLTRSDMSETEQAALDLKQSEKELANARAQVERAKNDPSSPAYTAAVGRLKVAQQNAATNAGRLGLETTKYKADYFGTDAQGNPLPGALLTDNGTPVGIRTANITKPTNATRSKAEQAGVIKQQGEDILRQIDANPDLYGVVAGRWNEFNAGKFGNASQEVRDAYTSLKSFAALQPALHGARGIGMMKEFEDAVGSMGNDPEALRGSVNSLLRTAGAFQKAGTMKTSPGGAAHPAATHVYNPATGVISPVGK